LKSLWIILAKVRGYLREQLREADSRVANCQEPCDLPKLGRLQYRNGLRVVPCGPWKGQPLLERKSRHGVRRAHLDDGMVNFRRIERSLKIERSTRFSSISDLSSTSQINSQKTGERHSSGIYPNESFDFGCYVLLWCFCPSLANFVTFLRWPTREIFDVLELANR
jgi:hypothetical protein